MSEAPKYPVRPDRVGLGDWLMLGRAVPSAWDVRKLALAAMGLAAVQAGWAVIDANAPGSPESWGPMRDAVQLDFVIGSPGNLGRFVAESIWDAARPLSVILEPISRVFWGPPDTILVSLIRLIWALATLGVAGGAVARLAMSEAAGDSARLGEAVGFALRRLSGLVGAPTLPLALALTFLAAATFVGGLTTGAAIVLAIPIVVLLVQMAAAWPLMPAAAVDGDGATESVGRCFGYVNRRPMSYAACIGFSWILGTLGLAAFRVFVVLVLHLADRAAGWNGASGVFWHSGPSPWAAAASFAWSAWSFAYFWCAGVRIYLLLRQDVDDVPSWGSAALR